MVFISFLSVPECFFEQCQSIYRRILRRKEKYFIAVIFASRPEHGTEMTAMKSPGIRKLFFNLIRITRFAAIAGMVIVSGGGFLKGGLNGKLRKPTNCRMFV
jgi:hypothetical protein